MGTNLQLLGLQSIKRLAKRFDVKLEFPEWPNLYGISPKEFQSISIECGKILQYLFEKFNVSWWDVYLNSDIGRERMSLAEDMELKEDDTVLDVGCGRGYFTMAASKFSKYVVGLDLMDGYGRNGWWKNFKESMEELHLTHKVYSLKADARLIPFKDSSFSIVAAVHSIRNFQDQNSVERSITEMKRVVEDEGNVIVVENLPIAKNKAQEAHLAMFRCKCKYSVGELYYFSEEDLLKMFEKVGFKETEVKIVDYNLSATPPLFYLNTSFLNQKRKSEAERDYNMAIKMIRKYGETSPPTIIIKATKHVI